MMTKKIDIKLLEDLAALGVKKVIIGIRRPTFKATIDIEIQPLGKEDKA